MDWNQKIKKLAQAITTNDDPLDGDDTERLGKLFQLELDWQNGNITQEEYNEMLRRIEKHKEEKQN